MAWSPRGSRGGPERGLLSPGGLLLRAGSAVSRSHKQTGLILRDIPQGKCSLGRPETWVIHLEDGRLELRGSMSNPKWGVEETGPDRP